MSPDWKNRDSDRSGGFSLIELLVVTSIIAILAAMLLSGITVVKRMAKSAVCTSNLRQIGMAIDLYSQDQNGYLPTARQGKNSDITWFSLIGPYTDAKEVNGVNNQHDIHDDAARNVVKSCPNWRIAGTLVFQVGYGMNSYARYPQDKTENSWDPATSLFPDWTIDMPTKRSSRTLVGDSGDWHIIYNKQWYGLDPWRHVSSANYLFFDYHVAAMGYDEAVKSILNP